MNSMWGSGLGFAFPVLYSVHICVNASARLSKGRERVRESDREWERERVRE